MTFSTVASSVVSAELRISNDIIMSSLLQQVGRAGLQSGTIMATADAFTQTAIEGSSSIDLHRTGRWAVAGLAIHGPYFFLGFRRVDQYFGAATSLKVVAYKTATAQFVLFPPYLVALFSYFGYVEHGTVKGMQEKVSHCVPAAFVGGCVFWPVANVLNFGLVPSTLRVPYLAASAGVWNSYLSWTNAKDDKKMNKT